MLKNTKRQEAQTKQAEEPKPPEPEVLSTARRPRVQTRIIGGQEYIVGNAGHFSLTRTPPIIGNTFTVNRVPEVASGNKRMKS